MRNTEREGVLLVKVVRRHTFILGKSTVLARDSVVQLDSGEVGLHYVRRDGKTGFISFPWSTYEDLVSRKREFEYAYVTAEDSAP